MATHRVCAAITVNYISYSAWTLLNKYQFEPLERGGLGVKTPILATSAQMLLAGLIAAVVVLGVGVGRGAANLSSPATVLTRIFPLGLSRAIDIGCGNLALSMVSVALQQVFKSMLPLFVTVLSVFFFGKVYSRGVWVSLIPIIVGTSMASAGEIRAAGGAGVTLAAVACVGRSLKAVLNGYLLELTTERLSPLELLLLEAPMTGLMLGAVGLALEGGHVMVWSSTIVWGNLVGGALMFFNQASYILLIDLTSPVTTQIFMNIKMLVLIFVSLLLFPTSTFTWVNCMGALVAGAGSLLYGRVMLTTSTPTGVPQKIRVAL